MLLFIFSTTDPEHKFFARIIEIKSWSSYLWCKFIKLGRVSGFESHPEWVILFKKMFLKKKISKIYLFIYLLQTKRPFNEKMENFWPTHLMTWYTYRWPDPLLIHCVNDHRKRNPNEFSNAPNLPFYVRLTHVSFRPFSVVLHLPFHFSIPKLSPSSSSR